MLEEVSVALAAYQREWEALVAARQDKAFFGALEPTAVCWKAVDLDDFDRRFAELRPACHQIHLGWVNERWLATMVLKQPSLPAGLQVVKLFERRPGSDDPAGLDHLDFLLPATADPEPVLKLETGLQWTRESNGEHCKWISLWFDGAEAKLRQDTVLRVCADELTAADAEILRAQPET